MQRLLAILGDGMLHPMSRLLEVLEDPLADTHTVQVHISALRKQLRRFGHDIICVRNGRTSYQLVRQMANPYRGIT
jgi:DNA-binding winged helix-turn-helix (wHTH) protein